MGAALSARLLQCSPLFSYKVRPIVVLSARRLYATPAPPVRILSYTRKGQEKHGGGEILIAYKNLQKEKIKKRE
jgi:hypothetical protein